MALARAPRYGFWERQGMTWKTLPALQEQGPDLPPNLPDPGSAQTAKAFFAFRSGFKSCFFHPLAV